MTVEKYIDKHSFVISNPNNPLISLKDAEKAIEMAREEERNKARKAYILTNEQRYEAEKRDEAFIGMTVFNKLLKKL